MPGKAVFSSMALAAAAAAALLLQACEGGAYHIQGMDAGGELDGAAEAADGTGDAGETTPDIVPEGEENDAAGEDPAEEEPAPEEPAGCTASGCSGRGTCNEATGLCDCDEGYEGDFCERCAPGYERDPSSDECFAPIDCSDPGACSHHGTCLEEGGRGRCECREGRFTEAGCGECSEGYSWLSGICALSGEPGASLDRSYDWYKSQMDTGPHSSNNCGPASAAMAVYWYDESLDVDPGDVREAVTGGTEGWWNTANIQSALDLHGVPNAIMEFNTLDDLTAQVEAGHVLILCLTMDMVSREIPPHVCHFNRFYTYDSGHFLVVKGYAEDGDWLDIHDPNSWSSDYYTDGEPYGKDRFYRGTEVLASAGAWWPHMIVVGASRSKGLDPGEVPLGWSGP